MTKAKKIPLPPLDDEAKSNLVGFIETLIEIDQAQKELERQLEDKPKGFALHAEGRECHGCGSMIFDEDMWFDKWGAKCMKCQEALNKKAVPGYIFKDYNHEKSINISDLSFKTGLHQMTIKKLARQNKLKARTYKCDKGELWIFLRKENPNLNKIVDQEKQAQAQKHKTQT